MQGKINEYEWREHRADCIKVYGLKSMEVISGAMNSPIVSMFLKVISCILWEMGNCIWVPIELCVYYYGLLF